MHTSDILIWFLGVWKRIAALFFMVEALDVHKVMESLAVRSRRQIDVQFQYEIFKEFERNLKSKDMSLKYSKTCRFQNIFYEKLLNLLLLRYVLV